MSSVPLVQPLDRTLSPLVVAIPFGSIVGIRQNGVVMGLEFDHPEGAKYVLRHLYANGVWAIF